MRKGFITPHGNLSINERLDRLVRAGEVLSELYDRADELILEREKLDVWNDFDRALSVAAKYQEGDVDRNGHRFVVGARVVAYTHVDRFPHFLLPPGVTGTVSQVDDHYLYVRVDEPWAEKVGDEWEYQVSCSLDDEGDAPAPWEEWIVTSPLQSIPKPKQSWQVEAATHALGTLRGVRGDVETAIEDGAGPHARPRAPMGGVR